MRLHFFEIKRLFFRRWDRHGLWRVSTRSRRTVHGRCDREGRVIEIVVQHADPDERDKLLIHEICHAVADMGLGKKWRARMEKAARRADKLGRHRLAHLLREEITAYQRATEGLEQVYQTIQDWLMYEPDLTLRQVKWALAKQYGLLYSEVGKTFRRTEKVFREAKREALEERALEDAFFSKEGKT
jgi:hypothetical protein